MRRTPLRPSPSLWLSNVSPETIRSGLRTFPGLPHRMEEVGRIGATLFINDSKATNADSTEKALNSFDDILWILGGKAKEGGIEPLTALLPEDPQGLSHRRGGGRLCQRRSAAHVPHVQCGTLDKAVAQAAADAQALGGASRRAAVAGLRVLRPVSELRSARKPLPRSGPGLARHRSQGGLKMVSRAERSAFGDWWWTVDRLLLAGLAALMLAGLVFLMAGGPPVAERLGLSTFHFVNRQVLFLVPALCIMRHGLVPVAAPSAAPALCWSMRSAWC